MAEKELKINISDEERERRSEAMKKLHAEGKAGKSPGRPPKDRAQEHIAEKVKDEAENIYRALKDGLKNKNSATVRMKAALALLDIERQEVEHQLKKEDRMYDNLGKEKMLELIQARMKQLEDAGINIHEVIEGTATELVEAKELESGRA